ncbi:MAG: ROK family protein [Candidatus Aminicenantes bacterium]|nr:MAG: ROK family protein [Candidatus Aminicenantes bacterium]
MNKYVVGVDLGGTKVEACLLDKDRNLFGRKRVSSEASKSIDHVVQNIANIIHEVSEGKDFAAVGMGTPGTYVPSEDRLYGAPHTPIYEDPGLVQGLQKRLDVPLVVDNDANCLALAEFFASCEGKYRYVMAVILGTGVGCGLILDNKLYRGSKGGAGEIGHTSIDINGRVCECGLKGCVEAYLSGPSHSRRYLELSSKKLDLREIYALFEKGDPIAHRLFEESCRIMGVFFANTINALDLEAVILGGGVSNIPLWYEKVPPLMKQCFFGIPRKTVPIIKARLGDSAGVFGAAYLALRELGIMDF